MDNELRNLLSVKNKMQKNLFAVMEAKLIDDICDYVINDHINNFYINNVLHSWYIEYIESAKIARIWFKTNEVMIERWMSTFNSPPLSKSISARLQANCTVTVIGNVFMLEIA